MQSFDLPLTIGIEVLNDNVGRTLWYTEFRFLYIGAGGKKENAARVLERLVAHFHRELQWSNRIGHGRFVFCDVKVLKRIEYC